MHRLIEQPAGEGPIFYEGAEIGRAHYHLAVYQHFSDQQGESVPAHLEVEGTVSGNDDLDLSAFARLGFELTLRLTDGRLLDFRITGDRGSIHSTGRVLYSAAGSND